MERQINRNSIWNRELSNCIKELPNSNRDLSNSITELKN